MSNRFSIPCKSIAALLVILFLAAEGFAVSNDAKEVWPRPQGTYIPNATPGWRDHLATGYNHYWKGNYAGAFGEWHYEVNHNSKNKAKTKHYQTIHSLIGLMSLAQAQPDYFNRVDELFRTAVTAFPEERYFFIYAQFLYQNDLCSQARQFLDMAVRSTQRTVPRHTQLRNALDACIQR